MTTILREIIILMNIRNIHITLFFGTLLVLGILTGCSLMQRVLKPSEAHKTKIDNGDYTWKDSYIDEAGWQSYAWYQDVDTLRLRAIADSLIALGEQVPDEVSSKLNRSNYVETFVPSICYDIVTMAKDYIGCRYGAGKAGPDRFDCSGFTSYIYRLNGISIGRSSRDQFLQGTEITDQRRLRPGDLVFWTGSNSRSKEVGHVGIVVSVDIETGDFSFIHAARTGIQIDQSKADYYAARYRGARRLL